jgi:membrane fusion protein, multidrug efflux system
MQTLISRSLFLILVSSGFLATMIFTTGCHPSKGKSTVASEIAAPAVNVRVQTVQARQRMATEDVVGTVRPKLSAVLSSKISGTVAQMRGTVGQTFKAGQQLVELDAREIQARLDQAMATRDQADKDLQRFKSLLDSQTATQQEYDTALSRARVADAAVKEAETMRGYTQILAPFDGVVTAKRADVGDMAAPGKALLDIEDTAVLRFEADVPEGLIDHLHMGDRLRVQIAAKSSIEGQIVEIAPIADPSSRTYRVKFDLPSAAGLRSGQFGRVAIPVAEVSGLRVPGSALVTRGQMEIVFVNNNGKAALRLVKSGKRIDQEIEIVSGLNPGEQVVIEGAAGLVDGQPLILAQP